MDTPLVYDEESLDKIYGLPHAVSVEVVFGTTIKGSAKDYSTFESRRRFDLWKYDVARKDWIFLHSSYATADDGIVSYSEDVEDEGCGRFLYGVWAENSYPDGLSGEQFGGFTRSVVVFCSDDDDDEDDE